MCSGSMRVDLQDHGRATAWGQCSLHHPALAQLEAISLATTGANRPPLADVFPECMAYWMCSGCRQLIES